MLKNIWRVIVTFVLGLWVRFVCATVRFRGDVEMLAPHQLLGFWHGDTQGALAMLRLMGRRGVYFSAITTTGWRGDLLSNIIARYGHTPLRMPDGMEMRRHMKTVLAAAKDTTRLFGMALDGPAGPHHEMKPFVPRLAADTGREFVTISFEYSCAIKSKRRWDMYRAPLPFSTVTLRVNVHGKIDRAFRMSPD
jgi:lysophospholipid acyltransferase (LPLAT)-like uncharacterized protein